MQGAEATRANVVESIYAAAASPALWPDAKAAVCDAIGADGGLIAYHPRSSRGFLLTSRLREDLTELYLKEYTANPFAIAGRRFPFGQPYLVNTIVDMNAVRRTAFFADILEPQRIESLFQTTEPSLSTDGGIGGFGFSLNARQLDMAEATHRRLKPLVAHLGRALDISLDIGRRLPAHRGLAETIAAMPGVALLLDDKGKVTFANAAAELLLADNDGLIVRPVECMRLSAQDDKEDAALARAIKASVLVACGIDAEWTGTVRVSRRSGRPALVLLLTPLPAPFHPFGPALPQRASVLVQVLGGPSLTEEHAAAFAKLYGLTETEARVAALIGSGHSTPQAAARLGVSAATVRTHLSHCFDKTGVRSQVELARLLALMPSNRASL
jgi:DNA-binding CsgD family transcriptional regulator